MLRLLDATMQFGYEKPSEVDEANRKIVFSPFFFELKSRSLKLSHTDKRMYRPSQVLGCSISKLDRDQGKSVFDELALDLRYEYGSQGQLIQLNSNRLTLIVSARAAFALWCCTCATLISLRGITWRC